MNGVSGYFVTRQLIGCRRKAPTSAALQEPELGKLPPELGRHLVEIATPISADVHRSVLDG